VTPHRHPSTVQFRARNRRAGEGVGVAPASIEIDPEHIGAVAEKYGMSILGPSVNHPN
jgi:hypothetical protein